MRMQSLPAQLIQTEEGTVLKRGCIEILFHGQNSDHLSAILGSFRKGATQKEVLTGFAEEHRPDILALIELLQRRNVLVPIDDSCTNLSDVSEDSLSLFYWHFDPCGHSIPARLRSRKIAILGVNSVSRRLSASLQLAGFENTALVMYPSRFCPESKNPTPGLMSANSPPHQEPLTFEAWFGKIDWASMDCLVATSDCGGRDLLREWNELAMQHRCHFLPIVLQDVIGYLGPLVIPNETACYECLISRENSHQETFTLRRAVEHSAFRGQPSAFHPLMASVLADVAAFEMARFYSQSIPGHLSSSLIEVNLLGASITRRKVLKVPRCVVCSTLHTHQSVSIYKNAPEHE